MENISEKPGGKSKEFSASKRNFVLTSLALLLTSCGISTQVNTSRRKGKQQKVITTSSTEGPILLPDDFQQRVLEIKNGQLHDGNQITIKGDMQITFSLASGGPTTDHKATELVTIMRLTDNTDSKNKKIGIPLIEAVVGDGTKTITGQTPAINIGHFSTNTDTINTNINLRVESITGTLVPVTLIDFTAYNIHYALAVDAITPFAS